MQKSEKINELCKALTLFHVKVDSISKDAKNPFFKSSYATLHNIQEAIREPLAEAGLTVCQFPDEQNGLTTIVMHTSGQWIESTYYMNPVKNDPQSLGSSITYQRRYALCSALNLSIGDEDDDANIATHGKSTPVQSQASIPANEKEWLNKGTKNYLLAIEKLKAGTTTVDKIKSAYRLSKETTELFNMIASQSKKEISDSSWTDSESHHYRGGD
jgi:hypothetical protein